MGKCSGKIINFTFYVRVLCYVDVAFWQVFEGHTHYVMQVAINPKDNNQFASASLDKTIKVWNLGSSVPNYTLEGHDKGVNCVSYYYGGEKPYLISGADDR